MGVEGVSVAEALSHADTLEISYHLLMVMLKLLNLFNKRLHTKSLKYST